MGQLAVNLSAKIDLLTKAETKERTGIAFPRYFTTGLEPGKTPYDEIRWETRTASIGNDKGAVIFEQRDVEVPVDWSQTATNIVASKYFHGKTGFARARNQRGPAGGARGQHHRRLGREGRLLQDRRRRRKLPRRTGPPDAHPEGLLQFAGLVQRGREGSPRLRLDLRRKGRPRRQARIRRRCARSARPASSFR